MNQTEAIQNVTVELPLEIKAIEEAIPQAPTNAEMSTLTAECERIAREAIKYFNLTVKPENIIMTIQTKGRKSAYGWFWGESWNKTEGTEKKSVHEINLCAEYLSTKNMGEVILHELAHAENRTLEIRDCSASQMHNKKFKVMAEKLGLEVKPRHPRYGYGLTDLAEEGKKFLDSVGFKEEMFKVARMGKSTKTVQPTRLVKCECPVCGYTIRVTRKWIDQGMPTCTGCNEKFETSE